MSQVEKLVIIAVVEREKTLDSKNGQIWLQSIVNDEGCTINLTAMFCDFEVVFSSADVASNNDNFIKFLNKSSLWVIDNLYTFSWHNVVCSYRACIQWFFALFELLGIHFLELLRGYL
ncbi:putative N-glycosylase/DNA lyase [Trichinella spiralis]|uniref:putative N-glycosylase/DNA lyase n=1 Tax=Trichinella spiralis TaxID=6334 RepID=UPI0001EFE716|nr:putative N-glycosylase/DNA lyase [Trichinella spiralis]